MTAAKATGSSKSKAAAKRAKELEPRGRPRRGQPTFSGATEEDPLVSVQVLKVRQSVWSELAQAAAERKWHRSVLLREILDEWLRRRKAAGGAGAGTENGKAA